MDELATLGRTLGFSLAAGVNLYATVAILGLAARYGWVALPDQRAVVTLNRRHVVRPYPAEPSHAGIIACSFDPDFDGQAACIHQAVATQESLVGRLIRVNRTQR